MILNGLGFMDDRLYMFKNFLENKPVDRLFGKGVKASYFNDDALARISHHCGKMGCKSLQNWKRWLIRPFLKKRIFKLLKIELKISI